MMVSFSRGIIKLYLINFVEFSQLGLNASYFLVEIKFGYYHLDKDYAWFLILFELAALLFYVDG
jgi:hypothetical protein